MTPLSLSTSRCAQAAALQAAPQAAAPPRSLASACRRTRRAPSPGT